MLSRREIIGALGAIPAASLLGPGELFAQAATKLPKRVLGRTGFAVTPYALGGIGMLAHPLPGMDPADIVVRAIQLGINYLDCANMYGPSQSNYGEAFRRMHLTPSDTNYNAKLRSQLYVASKTMVRYAFNPPAMNFNMGGRGPGRPQAGMSAGGPQGQGNPQGQAGRGPTGGTTGGPPMQGPPAGQPGRGGVPGGFFMAQTAVEDLKHTMTQMFGDGQGYVPEGAYLDCMQIHNLTNMRAVDQIYEGLAERGSSKKPERFGALAGLLDYRDGTNFTGTNPERLKWIRHIGITSHANSNYLMRALRLDTQDIFDTVLFALNPNDRNNDSMQHNILPLANAKGMGVIAMKLFADGVMFGGRRGFLMRGEDAIKTVGKADGPNYGDLVRYPLSFPEVSCAVVGISTVNRDKPESDQLLSNLAQSNMDLPDATGRLKIEQAVADRVGKDTNFFQEKRPQIIQPTQVMTRKDGDRIVVEWNTALSGPDPIRSYEIHAGQKVLSSLPYRPQLTEAPLVSWVNAADAGDAPITVVASTAAPKSRG